MTKKQWLYLGMQRKRSIIELKHDEKKGHLMVTFNKNILLLDEQVFDKQVYTFYIDEEVCKIRLSKRQGKFHYDFIIDKQINTPLNRKRKKKFRLDILKSAGLFGAVLAVFGIIFLGGYLYNKHQDTKFLASRGVETVATFKVIDPGAFKRWRNVIYTYGGNNFSGFTNFYSKKINRNGEILLPTGFPLEDMDEFYIRYDPFEPIHNYKIFFDRPSDIQFDRYRELITDRWNTYNEGGSEAYCECLLDLIYKDYGTAGLGAFYHQWTPASRKNRKHNEKQYQRIRYQPDFLDKEVQCWQFQ